VSWRCGGALSTPHAICSSTAIPRSIAQGRFAFTSVAGGEYLICFATNSSRWLSTPRKFRLDLRLDVGETGIDYAEVAKKEHLTELEVEVSATVDTMEAHLRLATTP